MKNLQNKTPYETCDNRESRDVFRLFMGTFPDKWDWSHSTIPSILTEEMIKERKDKLKTKSKNHESGFKKREKEEPIVEEKKEVPISASQKRGILRPSTTLLSGMKMDPAVRARLDREKR